MGRETEHSAHLSMTGSISQRGYHLFRGTIRVNDVIYSTEKEAMEAYRNLADQTNVKVKYLKW